ncbi:MAG: cytochrome c biogenesis protein CcsA [Planctomycetota bacterium]
MRHHFNQRPLRTVLALVALTLASACAKRPEHKIDVAEPRPFTWSKEVLATAGEIPVQHLGRVKPLSTVAAFSLLKINGKRKYELPVEAGVPTAGETLDPTAWMLDVLFFPEQAAQYDVFLVEESAVLEGVGLRFDDRKRRDRYSYDQLMPARQKILAAYRAAIAKDERQRSPVDRQSIDLHMRLTEFEALAGTMDFARLPVPDEVPAALRAALGEGLFTTESGGARMSATAFLTHQEELLPVFEALRQGTQADAEGLQQFQTALTRGLDTLTRTTEGTLHFLAPEVGHDKREEWDAPGDVFAGIAAGTEPRDKQIAALTALADGLRQRLDVAAVAGSLAQVRDGSVALAEARGDYKMIALERTYYRIDFFYNALAIFLLAFLLAAASWAAPGVRGLRHAVTWTTAAGAALVIAGVTVRCILRGRPPVVSLYDTILFITGTGVVLSLVMGRLMRLPLAATMGAFLGAIGMFMANRYELREAATSGDTMATVQAVLDTNFWLATHVTSVTLGYSAGLFACLLAHVWLGARIFGFRKGDTRWFRQLGRAVYGIVAFGLLFSVVGTILGGIWANDSWGRFWGWDPKENGALMICLFELALVHARLGGYVKDFGVAVGAVLLGPVVAFSWWHVNLLGVGLHSYGFTAGIKEWLFLYYKTELAVATLAFVWWLVRGRTDSGGRGSIAGPPASAQSGGA